MAYRPKFLRLYTYFKCGDVDRFGVANTGTADGADGGVDENRFQFEPTIGLGGVGACAIG